MRLNKYNGAIFDGGGESMIELDAEGDEGGRDKLEEEHEVVGVGEKRVGDGGPLIGRRLVVGPHEIPHVLPPDVGRAPAHLLEHLLRDRDLQHRV